jgi:hypothetical protein
VELVVGHGASGEVALVGDADAVVEVLAEVVAVPGDVLDAPTEFSMLMPLPSRQGLYLRSSESLSLGR